METITIEEYQKWRAAQIEIGRRKLLSVLEAWGIPSPAPRVWEKEWRG
jgi:hypothetical protein